MFFREIIEIDTIIFLKSLVVGEILLVIISSKMVKFNKAL